MCDACVTIVPEPDQGITHGSLCAVAEGLAERPEAEEAARVAVRELSNSYYATHEGWGLVQALQESFNAANQAMLASGERGRAAALSALILRGRRWVVAHAGNTRVWLFREHGLKLLTHDHVLPRPKGPPLIDRACGLETQVAADITSGELAEGDIFLLTSDGVHNVVDGTAIISVLQTDVSAQQMADELTQRALASGSRDNVSACVAHVEKLPAETDADIGEGIATLPVVNPPEIDEVVDGFVIQSLQHKSQRYRLYRAFDRETEETVLLKFPNPRHADDPTFISGFLHEEWIGKRTNSSYLIRMLPLRPGRRTALYSVMAYHRGENLAKRVRRKQGLPLRQALFLMDQLLSALSHLHRKGVTHRDIRPKNLLLDKQNKQLLLIGLGASRIEGLEEPAVNRTAPIDALNYQAPELFDGQVESERSDLYSAGVTLYYMVTGKYPYGRITARDRNAYGEFVSPSGHRPELPPWLDEVLKKACALDPRERHASAEAFAADLAEAGARNMNPPAPAATPIRTGAWGRILIVVLVLGLLAYLIGVLK